MTEPCATDVPCSDAGYMPGSCTGAGGSIAYQYDDFGNLIRVKQPWVSTGSAAGGSTTYNYDARGDMTLKYEQGEVDGSSNLEYLSYQYDFLGRLLTESDVIPALTETNVIVSYAYDNALTPDTNCPSVASAYTLGRVQAIYDGNYTWFAYDKDGRVLDEYRETAGSGANCAAGGVWNNPSTSYTYNNNGDLTSVTYPHGRGVDYSYGSGGLSDRVASVNVCAFSSGSCSFSGTSTIQAVTWEPYGGLRSYLISGTPSVEVQYVQAAPTGSLTSCPSTVPTSAPDGTGLPQSLWVTSPDGGTHVLYSQTYNRVADQMAEVDTCVLSQSVPTAERYSYDTLLRLSSAAADGGASFGARNPTFDVKGNLTSMTVDSNTMVTTYDSTYTDRITSWYIGDGGSYLQANYGYARDDGYVTSKTGANDSSSDPNWSISFNENPDGQAYSSDSPFVFSEVGGLLFTYGYDYAKRRNLKSYPSGINDYFFYDRRSHLIEDLGNSDLSSPTYYTDDDYVWLGGRPIVLARGQFNTSFVRGNDSGTCNRNGNTASCGFYYPVTDYQGKPVLMLNGSAQVTGTGDYDPSGNVNRVSGPLGNSDRPSYSSGDFGTLGTYSHTVASSGMTQDFRARLYFTDTRNWITLCTGTDQPNYDYVALYSGATLLTNQVGGVSQGQAWTSWTNTASSLGSVTAEFNEGYYCTTSGMSCSCSLDTGASFDRAGVALQGYEYRQYTASTPFWTPLRYPGQYHDEETDTMQNWNRVYDPDSWRYLEPESMWQMPLPAFLGAYSGQQMAAYGFAAINPVNLIDENGKQAAQAAAVFGGEGSAAGVGAGFEGALAGLGADLAGAASILIPSPIGQDEPLPPTDTGEPNTSENPWSGNLPPYIPVPPPPPVCESKLHGAKKGSNTPNPFKKLIPDPNKPGNVLDTNKDKRPYPSKPAPPRFWDWWNQKHGGG